MFQFKTRPKNSNGASSCPPFLAMVKPSSSSRCLPQTTGAQPNNLSKACWCKDLGESEAVVAGVENQGFDLASGLQPYCEVAWVQDTPTCTRNTGAMRHPTCAPSSLWFSAIFQPEPLIHFPSHRPATPESPHVSAQQERVPLRSLFCQSRHWGVSTPTHPHMPSLPIRAVLGESLSSQPGSSPASLQTAPRSLQ